MSSQFFTMPFVIGYDVSSISRALVTSSPTMISFSSTSCTFSSARRTGRPMMDGKMCDGKLSPANPHLTNCAQRGTGKAVEGEKGSMSCE